MTFLWKENTKTIQQDKFPIQNTVAYPTKQISREIIKFSFPFEEKKTLSFSSFCVFQQFSVAFNPSNKFQSQPELIFIFIMYEAIWEKLKSSIFNWPQLLLFLYHRRRTFFIQKRKTKVSFEKIKMRERKLKNSTRILMTVEKYVLYPYRP